MPPAIGRARERKVDAPERAPRVEAQRPRGLDQRRRALEECRAREQIHVRIQRTRRTSPPRRRASARRETSSRPSTSRTLAATRSARARRNRASRCTRMPSRTTASRAAAAAPTRRSARRESAGCVTSQRGDRAAERHTRADQRDERERVGDEPGQHRCREMRPYRPCPGASPRPSTATTGSAASAASTTASATSGERLRIDSRGSAGPRAGNRSQDGIRSLQHAPIIVAASPSSLHGRAGRDGYNRRVPMRILLSNDDGYFAPGLERLAAALASRAPRSPSSRRRPTAAARRTR